MESSPWPENLPSSRIQAIQELIQGRKVINNLYEMLGQAKKIETGLTSEDGVMVQIVGLFENTLAIIESNEHHQHLMSSFHSPNSSDGHKSNKLYGSLSIPTETKRVCYKRRKNSWTSTQVASVLVDDGHAWRKYGQKQILNSKHQRSYYRCTYKFDQGCLATKHVQKIMDKPTRYKTTYMGQHTCRNLQRSPPIILDSMNPIDTSILLSFETKGFIEKKQNDPSLNSIKHEPKDGFSVGDLKPNMSWSSEYHLPWDPSPLVPHEPLEPVSITTAMLDHEHIIPLGVHSGFDQGNMISVKAYSTKASPNKYEMDHMFERNDFHDFPYELCF